MKLKLPAAFRRMTIEEARSRLVKHARAMARHHQLEAMRLDYEAQEAQAKSDAHAAQAVAYSTMAEERTP